MFINYNQFVTTTKFVVMIGISMSTTRQKINTPYNVSHVPSGYEGVQPEDVDLVIPSNTLKDVDRSVFDLFDKELALQINVTNTEQNNVAAKKVPVIFAGGERLAFTRRLKPVRDKNGRIILPIITIKRGAIEQTTQDITGRGMNQNTGELIIKKKLSPKDAHYQLLINKLGLKNQNNSFGSERPQGSERLNPEIVQGGLLSPQILNNIYQFIVIPQPQFITVNYEITIWTSYMADMNKIITTIYNSFLPVGHRSFLLKTLKGYTFSAFMDEQFSPEDNFDDYTETERLVRYSVNLRVPTYVLPTYSNKDVVPFRTYVSAPNFQFVVNQSSTQIITKKQLENATSTKGSKFVLSEIVEDKELINTPTEQSQYLGMKEEPQVGKEQPWKKYVSITEHGNKQGETVFYVDTPEMMKIF